MLSKKEKKDAEIKLLTAIYRDEVFHGSTVRQERPTCCGRRIDIFSVGLCFRELNVGSRIYHLLEPYCPSCGKRITASYTILS